MKSPKVSIGMPVYNGEAFLAEALEALRAQTMPDLEIAISDNNSTDASGEIARKFARRDSRVKYSRTDRVIPPSENHTRAFGMCTGEYFKFAAHDDVHAPQFVERCLDILERDPSVVLAYPKVIIIDSEGQHVEDYNYKVRTDAPDPAARFGALVRVNHRIHGAYEIYGLIRKNALDRIPPEGNYPRADSIMLARLALLGRFHQIPEVLFYSREHANRSVRQLPGRVKSGRSRLARYIGTGPVPPLEWWDPSKKGVIHFPEWKIAKEYFTSIWMVPLSASQRVQCMWQMVEWLLPIGGAKLARDLVIAAEQIVAGQPRTAGA